MIDLRTLWPWDKAAVLDSVGRTGRLLVAHEAVSVAGFGAEVVATVCESLHGPAAGAAGARGCAAHPHRLRADAWRTRSG